ncbi:MAG: tRNA (adenosine(37)-N6)-threonylcarbamoyltransferase complex ATPase subunit type 1 TsaE [Chloroflexota bacterium]|jgi:tRNA threonylcarbamoyladenosine biosynthesis protein TsaE
MPILDARTLEFFSRSAEQTRRLGMRLGGLLQKGDVVFLRGELGSGKTTLAQGIAQGWGSLDAVSSPTFVLVNIYRRPDRIALYHLDAYRLQSAAEAAELDVDLMLDSGALVVEWPERIAEALPTEHLLVQLKWIEDEQRGMIFLAHGERYEALVQDFRRRVIGG